MRKFLFTALLIAGLASFSGCLVSDQPLPMNEKPSEQSAILGLWQSPWPAMQTKESLNVSYVAEQDYYVAVRARQKYFGVDDKGRKVETQESMAYKAYPFKAGDRTYFSLLSSKSETPVYAIVEARLLNEGKKLVIFEPSDEAVAQAMKEGTLPWRIEEDSKVTTAYPQALAVWIQSLEPDDWDVHETFERWPAPLNDLQKKLNSNQT